MAVEIRIIGAANMSNVSRELNRITATAATMQKQFDAANASMVGNPAAQIKNFRNYRTGLSATRDDIIDLTRANGQFSTSSLKVANQSDLMIERIQKQQLSFKGLRKELGAVQEAYRHHMALQRSVATTWSTGPAARTPSAAGRATTSSTAAPEATQTATPEPTETAAPSVTPSHAGHSQVYLLV